jgi:hypothetical protein
MEKVPDNIVDKELYLKVKKDIISKYPKHSAYRSMLIQKEYKNRDGKYKNTKNKNLNIWIDEKWINAKEYIQNGNIIKCGDKKYSDKSACRPLIRINNNTPITIKEVMKKFNKNDILSAINKKNNDPSNKLLYWKSLKVVNKN